MEASEHQQILVSALKHQDAEDLCWDKLYSGCLECDILPRTGYHSKPSIIIIGGISDPGNVGRKECWQLFDNGWEVMEQENMPTKLFMFSACVVKEGIIVSGGQKGNEPVSQCWFLSTSTFQWTRLPDLNTARARHVSVYVAGQVYVIGGQGADKNKISSVERVQKNNRQWDILPDLPTSIQHPMGAAYGKCVYVFGGIDVTGHTTSAYVYGKHMKSWRNLPDMPMVCSYGSAVVLKGMIYIVGGFGCSCMSFDPILNVWTTLSQCRHEHADGPALAWKDKILVCGGRSNEAKRDNGTAGRTSVIEEYDPEADNWAVSQIELPQRLSAHFMFAIR